MNLSGGSTALAIGNTPNFSPYRLTEVLLTLGFFRMSVPLRYMKGRLHAIGIHHILRCKNCFNFPGNIERNLARGMTALFCVSAFGK